MEQLVLLQFKSTARAGTPSTAQLVFYKARFSAIRELGMEPAASSFQMANAQPGLTGMELFVLLMYLPLALQAIHSMERCVSQLFLVVALKATYKKELNAIEKLLYPVLETLDGMELPVLVRPKEPVLEDLHGMALHVLVFNQELVLQATLSQDPLVLARLTLNAQLVSHGMGDTV